MLLWKAYVVVIDQGIPLVEDHPHTGDERWSRQMIVAMLRELHLKENAENKLRLEIWLMMHAATPDVSCYN